MESFSSDNEYEGEYEDDGGELEEGGSVASTFGSAERMSPGV